ncbi:36409_t:CDS:2, partial [Gigaspora margarita]
QASSSPTHYDIYYQVANRNLEDYRSKMEHQMHTKYKIQERNYKIGNLVKIQIAKIDRGPVFPGDKILLLGPKEFLSWTTPINTTVSIIEAARIQSNALASNKVCNCRGDYLIAKYFCKKTNVLCGSGYHPKNSK